MGAKQVKLNRFEQVMDLIFILSILTNCCLAAIVWYISIPQLMLLPIGAGIIQVLAYAFMAKELVSAKQAFIAGAYCIAFEVIVFTYSLGWDTGFIYYLYAISLVFLLGHTWKLITVILFNGSIIALSIIVGVAFKGESGFYDISPNFSENINSFNQVVIGLVILSIVIYFSYANQLKDKSLTSFNKELEAQNKEISEQKNHLEILLKEVHHRVKNNLQIISSLLSLQSRTVTEDKVLTVLNNSRRRVEAIALIHQSLYGNKLGNEVDFEAYINDLVDSQQLIQSNVKCFVCSETVALNLDIAVPLGLIISEMMTNSVKHAFDGIDDPKIQIIYLKNGNDFELVFNDNGIGLPEDFEFKAVDSLGMEIITALVDQIDGKIEWKNKDGAYFKINFSA